MGFLSRIDWSSWRTRSAIVAFAVILLLLPALWCSVYYTFYLQTPPMGRGDIDILADTFVSTEDDIDYSTETIIRVSNISDGEDETIEIAFIEFEMTIPPAGSYLADLVFEFHCTEVPVEGFLRFHKCDSFRLESNVTYENMPEFDPLPFTNITLTQNSTYTISLHEEGGYIHWLSHSGLFAITADRGTQITIHSSDAEPRFQPQIDFYTPFGLWINPAEYPQLCYAHPLAWISVLSAVVLLSLMCVKSLKLRNGAEGEI
ncbi:MAG: hypothetical protein ACXAEE_09255 [Candidatus Thorarchaeota archaeon]